MREPGSRPATPLRALALLALLAATLPAARATDLAGDLTGNLPAGLYRIVDDIRVPAGETLTLEAGVIFEFEEGLWSEYEFDVEGTLLAEGTAAQPIEFRAAPGVAEYNYLRLASSSTVLRHCRIRDAGRVTLANQGGLWIDDCRPLLEACEVRDGSWHGIYVTGGAAQPTLCECSVHDNAGDGIDADAGAGLIAIHCRVTGNGGDGVCVAAGSNTLVGCLIARNGEDGVDSHGLADYPAMLINCTIADHPGEGLSDCASMTLYNTLVAGAVGSVAGCFHSYLVADPAYYRFVDHAGGDFRLGEDSPCVNQGTRFGPPEAWLPATDLAGQPRIVGIVDPGAYESSAPVDLGEEGDYFSRALLAPRMTQPVIRIPEETLTVLVAELGTFSPAAAAVTLIDPLGEARVLLVEDLTRHELRPENPWTPRIHTPGLEILQELTVRVPADVPADFYDLHVTLGSGTFQSRHAVRILEAYPEAWRFIHITDPHIGYAAEAYSAAFRYGVFAREADFLNPHLVVVTGDICENQHLENGAFIDSLLEITARLHVPILIQPGNHDHYTEAGAYHPGYPLHYFTRINRFRDCHLRFGRAHFFAFNSGPDLGLLELYRCRGPESAALDWAETRLAGLDPLLDRPRFFLMHGPNYDYFSWNDQHVARVRDLMDAHGVSLALCGHTHRFETFLNEGENYFGRNDFEHEDDWGRDVPFPGYPLHVQTSSLGKEEHLQVASPALTPQLEVPALAPHRRGLFGDDIGWRYVAVADGEVTFFTADTDGDGYRNTEDPWLLGELHFSLVAEPDGRLIATAQNDHFETWTDLRHYIPAAPEIAYSVTGGTLLRRFPDGTAEVAVATLPALGSSQVALTPAGARVGETAPAPLALAIIPGGRSASGFAFELHWSGARPQGLRIYDAQGRCVRDLSAVLAGSARTSSLAFAWDGRGPAGRPLTPGVYFLHATAPGRQAVAKVFKVR